MSQTQIVRGVATSIRVEGDWTHIRYHATDVVSFSREYIVLRTGGWRTATTKVRMNQAIHQFNLWDHGGVCQEKGEWYAFANQAYYPYKTHRCERFDGDTLVLIRAGDGTFRKASDAEAARIERDAEAA